MKKNFAFFLVLAVLSHMAFGAKYYTDIVVEDGKIQMRERTATPTATANYGFIYPKNDGYLYFLDDGGNEYNVLLGGSANLDALLDVNVPFPATGDVLTYDGTEWVNLPSSGGIAAWVTAQSYVIDNIVHINEKIYRATVDHTSGVFATDLANGDWVEMSDDLNRLPSAPDNAFVFFDGVTGDIVKAGPVLLDGEILVGSTGATPTATTIQGTVNQVNVTTGPGSILLSGPQDLAATSSVTFNSLVLSTPLNLLYGGTSKALIPSAGGFVYSDSDSLEITATGTAGMLAKSAGSGAPGWGDIPASNTIYVDKAGNDSTCAVGAINRPCLTIAQAHSLITSPSAANRFKVKLGAGTWTEEVVLRSYTVIEGGGRLASRIIDNTGITLNAEFATSNHRTGLWNLYLSGSTGLNFDLVTLGAVGSIVFEVNEVRMNGSVNVTSTNNGSGFEFEDSWALGGVTISGATGLLRNCYIPAAIVLNTAGTSTNLNLTIQASITDTVSVAEDGTGSSILTLAASQITSLTTTGAVQLFVDSLPGTRSLSGTTTINRTSEAYGLSYDPTTPGDWPVVPDNVRDALDYLITGTGGGGGGGITTVGTIDSQAKSFDGASIVATTTIYMQTADANYPGLVSTGSQTIAGDKTLSGTTNLSALSASLPLKLDGSKNIVSAGIDLSSATEVLNVLPLNRGGTNKALTASAGSPVWTDADSLEVGTPGTTGQALISGGTGAPTWFSPTAGSALFAGTGGILQQDNANFFWDDTNNRLGLGINTSLTDTLHVVGSAKVDNIKLDANAITATDTNGNLELQSDGTGDVFYKKGSDVRKKVGSRNPELRQLLNYPSFEESVAEGTCTNCTSTSTATTGNMLGSLHLLMDFVSSTTGDYTVDKTTGWSNAVPGTASCYVRTTRPNVNFYARSNGTDALNIDVANDGNWAKYEIPFICGATSCGYKVAGTTADSTDIEVNECSISLQQTITPVGVIGQWQDYGGTASYTGVGTPTVTKLQYRQVGQNIEVRTSFTTGTVTAVEFRLALPPGYTLASSLGTNVSGGFMQRNSQNGVNFTVIGTGGDSYVRVARATNSGNVFTPIITSTDWNSSEISQMFFSFPVNELSASVNTLSVSQQNKVSQINFYNITNCNAGTSNGSYTDLVDTDCTYAAAQKIGTSVVTPTTTGAMALKVTNVPAGKYYVSLGGRLGAGSSTTCSFRLYDGTNPIALSYIDSPSGLFQTNDGAGGLVEYTTEQAVVEWKLQARVVTGSNNCQAGASDDNQGIMITMVPVTGVMTATIRDVMKTPGVSSMAPVFYSAEISAAGAVSHEIGDFINGSCGVAGTVITCNFNSGVFPTDANCTTTSYTNAARSPNIHSMTTSQVVVGGYDGSGANGPDPFKLMCHGY